MKPIQTATRLSQAALLACLGLNVFPVAAPAAELSQADREIRRSEFEARREQELGRRDMEERARMQSDALRDQEAAIRRLEATQSRLDANAQQRAQEAADQARIASYPNYPYVTPGPRVTPSVPVTPPAPLPVLPAIPAPLVQGNYAKPNDAVSRMSLAPLSEELGNYFGTRAGVLVVAAGAGAPFGLRDGDVILSIDGRVPMDHQHAAAILRSYLPGERLKLQVMRDRARLALDTVVPAP